MLEEVGRDGKQLHLSSGNQSLWPDIHFLKPHCKHYYGRMGGGGEKGLAGSDPGPIPFDFRVLYLEAIRKAFR